MSTILELKDLPLRSNDEVWYFPASNAFRVMEIRDTAWKLIKTRLMLLGKLEVRGKSRIQITMYDYATGHKQGAIAKFPDDFDYYGCIYKGFCDDDDIFIFYKI